MHHIFRWSPLALASTILLIAAWLAGGRPAASAQDMPPSPAAARQFLPLLRRDPTPGATPTATPAPTLVPLPRPTPTPGGLRASDFGLVWVNSAENPSGSARIQRGADTGARLDRFPIYWNLVETSPGQFQWSGQDTALATNEAQGLGTLAILLGEPGFYRPNGMQAAEEPLPPVGGSFLRNGGSAGPRSPQGACASGGPPAPRGLYDAIFSDGSDRPGPGKSPNPANPWAYWVGQAVNRYRPGGSAGLHVRYWEVWNEEDLCQFWTGSAAEYARLLEVAYLVIHQCDPDATVVWGGLAHYDQPQFLYDVIDTLRAAPMSAEFGGFFDAAAGHHYAILWDGYQWTARVRDALAAVGWGSKPIWITESGVPICNDFPGPTCPSPWRAAPVEQATWMWENVAYSRLAGGGPIFQFALHDDCGNVIDPHSPDGFGLIKNEAGSFCSPAGAEPRLAYTAFSLANRYFAGTELLWADIEPAATPRARRVAFYDPVTHERRTLVWALDGDVTVHLPATGSLARRVALDGSATPLAPANGEYTLALAAPTNRDDPDGSGGYDVGIYGVPYLLIETDTQPPITGIAALPAACRPTFPVAWTAEDHGSGLARVALYYQKDGGPWQLWWSGLPGGSVTGDGVSAGGTQQFNGESYHVYTFAVMASDRAGNMPDAQVVQAQTWTDDQAPEPQVAVSGQVVDVRNRPAAGVVVAVGTTSATTGSDGRYALMAPAGRWDVAVGGRVAVHGQEFAGQTDLPLLLRPANDVIINGDFEAGLAGWQTGGSCPLAVEVQPGTQDHALHLATAFVPNDGVPGQDGSSGGNSTLSTSVHVPTGQPYLALRYRVDSQETGAGHDRFEVIAVRNGQATYLYTQETASDWRTLSLDLSAYAGNDITIIFNLYQSSPQRPTGAYIDLVSVGE